MKLLRHSQPDSGQLTLQLDFFTPAPPETEQDAASSRPMPPPIARPATGMRRIRLSEHHLDYTLLRSRRRSIGFLINDKGLRVTAPKWVTLAEIENAIRENQRWIFARLDEQSSARRLQTQRQWHDGATLPYLGQHLALRIHAGQADASVAYDETALVLTICLPADAGEQQLKHLVQDWLQTRAQETFAARLPVYAGKLGVACRSLALSSASTRWGSCTADGRIRLNWRLIHCALPVIDYVIVHELSHLQEMNHSPRFWATVRSAFPECEAAKRALRESAPEILSIF
ncbi:MAG TPA: SprT family zinc-dependent metalloprotease [Herbaspirillum sp.]|nr:SprT family zinc-dependent metalloprotease [Herbaspirillum sp.]